VNILKHPASAGDSLFCNPNILAPFFPAFLAGSPKVMKMYCWTAFGLLALIMPISVSGEAMASCAPYPKIAIWSELTHEFARHLVDERYDGDWEAYLATLQRYERKLQCIHTKGLNARIAWRDKNVQLNGAKLAAFLKLVERRITVTRCLADGQSVADFSTAAGGTDRRDGLDTPVSKRCAAIPQVA